MPIEERKARQAALYRIILENDIKTWPERFLSALTGEMQPGAFSVGAEARRVPFRASPSRIVPQIAASRLR